MGTRLYPIVSRDENNNATVTGRATLERLAGVPEGTHDSLDNLEACFDARRKVLNDAFKEATTDDAKDKFRWAYQDLSSEEYDSKDEHQSRLSSFLLFGWGKFQAVGEFTEYGEETDPVAVAELLALNGITLDGNYIEGVHWG